MKQWYQYRCEEVDMGKSFTIEKRLSKRLIRFLLQKHIIRTIYWHYNYDFRDWRVVYGESDA